MMRTLLVSLLLVVLSSAHLCVLQPIQRGSINNINTPSAADCFLTQGKCGGRPAEAPKQVLKAGSNFTIVFQKNQDHWNAQKPGSFKITWEKFGHTGSFKVLKTLPDTKTPSLTLFTEQVTLPEIEYHHVILGVQYSVPSIGVVFHQCSDVEIRRFA